MISERKFAIAYTSFWRGVTPSADNFMRHINLAAMRYVSPHEGGAKASINGIINETAVRLAGRAWVDGRRIIKDRKVAESIWIEVVEWLGDHPFAPAKMPDVAWGDIVSVAGNVLDYLRVENFSAVEFEPGFRGCGVVSECRGDVLADDVLIEIKAGGRSFRLTDLRQLFIYFALARQAGDLRIKRFCLLNPRWGVAWAGSVEEAAIGCGASSAADLSEDIIRGAVLLGVSG